MNPKLQELVHNLLVGTQTGAFQWTATPEKGVYRLTFDKGLVRISQLGPRSVGDNFIGCTVLNAEGVTLYDVQVPRKEGDFLVALYDFVDGRFQEGAIEDLLAEVRFKMQDGSRRATAGQR